MVNQGLFLSQIASKEMEMDDPLSLAHAKGGNHISKPTMGDGVSSSNGMPRIKKVNVCLERSEDWHVLVIQPEQILEDIEYW